VGKKETVAFDSSNVEKNESLKGTRKLVTTFYIYMWNCGLDLNPGATRTLRWPAEAQFRLRGEARRSSWLSVYSVGANEFESDFGEGSARLSR